MPIKTSDFAKILAEADGQMLCFANEQFATVRSSESRFDHPAQTL